MSKGGGSLALLKILGNPIVARFQKSQDIGCKISPPKKTI